MHFYKWNKDNDCTGKYSVRKTWKGKLDYNQIRKHHMQTESDYKSRHDEA